MPSLALFGGLLAFLVAWRLFRNVDATDEHAWEGVALAKTAELLASDASDAAQTVADLWQLDAERDKAIRDAQHDTVTEP